VNFEKLFLLRDSTEDILVVPEDRIVIPSAQRTVHVFGQVVTAGNVPFVAGKDVRYYIAQCGGYTDDAEKGDVAVIKWTTRQWIEPGKADIEEGDFIWVPPVVRRPASYWLAVIGQTTSIISVALSIVLIAIQLKK
jgi:protein involved in polysaccharide export with SLBB domain